MAMTRIKRPMVVKAWMNHARTPYITELLVDVRRFPRRQELRRGWNVELKRIRAIYGKRWKGIGRPK